VLPPRLQSLGGVLALSAAMICFVVGDVFMRLVVRDLAVSEGLFIRGLIATTLVLLLIVFRGDARELRHLLSPPSVIRSLFEFFALIAFYAAMLNMPMAEANAIVQTTPLLLVLVVALWFREPVRPIEFGFVALGFLGTLLIVRPGAANFAPVGLLALVAAVLAVGRDLTSRRVDRAIPPFVVTLTMLVVVGAGMIPGALIERWRWPRAWEVGFIAVAAVLIAAAHLAMYVAFRLERPPRLAPFFYVALLASIVSGVVVFGEIPDGWSMAGMALIAFAGIGAAGFGALTRAS
jgi:drug/metabolite transporter (DMT)-like permease